MGLHAEGARGGGWCYGAAGGGVRRAGEGLALPP